MRLRLELFGLCFSDNMKPASDTIQIALSLPGPLRLLAALVIVLLLLRFMSLVSDALKLARIFAIWLFRGIFPMSTARLLLALILAAILCVLAGPVSDGLQWLEQVVEPAYVTGDTSAHALAVYEAELSRHCDPYEAEIVKRRTREIAAKVGCTPLAIYEVAYSECGLDPFRIRDDGVAAGWIQFTAAGLPGILTEGKQTTLAQVKDACKRRDVARIMDWTEQYLVSRSKGIPLVDACGVYTCVFAPGFVGHPEERVLYAGFENPAYYMNSIFDGYYVDNAGRIMRSRKMQDGKITIAEMRLHLEAKKSLLLRKSGLYLQG